MLKHARSLLMLSTLAITACGKGADDPASQVKAGFASAVEQICKCPDLACAEAVEKGLKPSLEPLFEKVPADQRDALQKEIEPLEEKAKACGEKLAAQPKPE